MTSTPERASTTEPAEPTESDGILSRRYLGLTIGIFSAIFLIAFEAMAVATAMPLIVRSLDGMAAYAWAFSGFSVAMMVATVVAGQACDRIGPVRPLLAGIGTFTVGLLVAGSATGMTVFVAGRMLQGLGAGAAVVAVYVVIARAYPERLRPRAFTTLSTAWVLPAIVGPLIAGAVAEYLTWRLVFLGLLPLVIFPPILVLTALRRQRVDITGTGDAFRLVVLGRALAAAGGVGLLQYAGQILAGGSGEGGGGAGGGSVVAGVVLGVVGLGLLVPSLPKLLPAGTIRFARGLPSVVGMRGLLGGAFIGVEAFVPVMLVEHRELSSTQAGLILTASALSWAGGAWVQGRPDLRMSRYRLVRLGTCSVLTGVILIMATLPTWMPPWTAVVGWLFAGLGMGLAFSSLSVLTLSMSEPGQQGENSASLQVSDAVGSVMLLGIGGVIFAALHASAGGVATFIPIYLSMAAVLTVGVLVAGRLRPAS